MKMLLEITIGIVTILALLAYYITMKWDYWTKRGVYQIKPKFPIGSFTSMVTMSQHLNYLMEKQAEETRGKPFYGGYFLRAPILVITDVDVIRQIMIKDFDNFVNRNSSDISQKMKMTNQLVDKIWMDQMTQAEGELWKNIRSTFTPIFTSGKMKLMMVFMQETSSRLMTVMDKFAEKDEGFELKETLGKFSMETIASCAFGVDAQAFSNDKSKFVEYAASIFQNSTTDGLKFMCIFIPFNIAMYIFRLFNIALMKKTETMFFYNVILESLKQRKESKTRRNDMIDLMVDAIKGEIEHDKDAHEEQFEKDAKLDHVMKKGEFDEMIIVATAIVILVAGYDTTGTTLSFTCYELAKNLEIQERLREEVENVVDDPERDITYEDLQKMPYIDQVIHETLRFHNPISLLQRSAERDYKVPGHDLVIEKDQQVWINVMAVHMDPKHYPNPKVYNPDNFSKEAKAARHPYAFLPFGQGPRGCIGMRFALLEAKLALANIVRRYNLLPSDKTKEPLELDPLAAIAYVKDGLYIKLEKRV